MAYISSEKVKEIREKIKKEFPRFKFSITKQHHSGVMIRIMAGPFDFSDVDHKQLNTYYLEKIYNVPLREMALKIMDIVHTVEPVKYHETGDYGTQPSFYTYIHLGEWDKPYKMMESKGEK